MEKRSITVTTEFSLQFDPNSWEFKEAFESYKNVIDHNANVDDMLDYVCGFISDAGLDTMIDGVGYVSYNGEYPFLYDEDLISGIDITDIITEVE